jgi:hypothetical protein
MPPGYGSDYDPSNDPGNDPSQQYTFGGGGGRTSAPASSGRFRFNSPVSTNAGFSNSANPEDMAQNDRRRAVGAGDVLDQETRDWTNSQMDEGDRYGQQGDSIYNDILNGGGGYTPGQSAGILRQGELDDLRFTDQDAADRQLTDHERQQIEGNPMLGAQWFARTQQEEGGGRIRGAVGGLGEGLAGATGEARQNFHGAIDPSSMGPSAGFSSGLSGEMDASRRNLALSDRYSQNRGWTPDDVAGLKDQAGRVVGSQYGAAVQDLTRRAEASGQSNPLSIAAARGRLLNEGAVHSANAITDASVAALEKQKQAEQDIESTRLGAAGQGANLRFGALQGAEGLRLRGAEGLQQGRLDAASGIANTASRNAATAGTAAIGAEEGINQGNAQTNQWVGDRILQAGTQGEQAQANRGALLGTNRQTASTQTQQDRFGQGFGLSQAGSQRNTTVANQDQSQRAEARGWVGGRQAQANQNVNAGQDRRLQANANTNAAANAATTNFNNAYNARKARPGIAGRIIGAAVGAGTAALTGGATLGSVARGALGGFAEGGVVTKPTLAIIGEAGPERVVPMHGHPSYQRPLPDLTQPQWLM